MKSTVLESAKSDSNLNDGKKDKKVHFADTIGLSLVSVYFIRDSAPRPLNNKINRNRRRIEESLHERVSYERARLLNFIQPLSKENLKDNLERNNVCLESVMLREYLVVGSVKVKNFAFEKRVFVRWTTDNWETHTETAAHYIYGSSTDTDNFAFELRMPTDLDKNFKLELAICYEVLGKQFWDNNTGDNFRIMWYACSQQTLKSRDLWDVFQSNRYAGFWI